MKKYTLIDKINAKKSREIVAFCNLNHTHDYEDGLCGFGKCRVAYGYHFALEGPEVTALVDALRAYAFCSKRSGYCPYDREPTFHEKAKETLRRQQWTSS